MNGPPLLAVSALSKRFGGLVVTDNLDLDLAVGEVHALIGPNGAGKSTLINQLCGDLKQDSGDIRLAGEQIGHLPVWQRALLGLARTFQITQLLPNYSALDTVALAIQVHQGHSFRFFADARKNWLARDEAAQYLSDVGLALCTSTRAENLGQGERKQLELAVALATKPKILLLDEPMAGLSPVENEQMIDLLMKLKGQVTMLIVEHDMEAVFALADRISVLVYGRVLACGSKEEIKENDEVRIAYLGEADV